MYLAKYLISFIDENTKKTAKKFKIDVDDLRQNVYLKLMEQREKDINKYRYIRSVIYNEAVNLYREEKEWRNTYSDESEIK
jgi:DNA-directed RNA polymerase specialized sigma24 family protein